VGQPFSADMLAEAKPRTQLATMRGEQRKKVANATCQIPFPRQHKLPIGPISTFKLASPRSPHHCAFTY